MKELGLSPTTLGNFKRCPRCFWLDKNRKLGPPRGIMPSLPGGMDRVLKAWYDTHRAENRLPQEIVGVLQGKLYVNQAALDRWRNWRSGMSAAIEHNGVTILLGGAVDDIFVNVQGLHEPFDAKTRGSAPKKGDSEKYYGTQLDSYGFLMQENNLPISGQGHLVYYWPAGVRNNLVSALGVDTGFDCQVVTLDVDPQRAVDLAIAATDCLMKSAPPDSHPNCEQCAWHLALNQKGY